MRFEHIIEINSPSTSVQLAVPGFTRAQLWQGMLIRVKEPGRFPLGPERCDWTLTDEGHYLRTLHFGQLVMRDRVDAREADSLVFTPEAHGDTTPIRLTMRIEEPHPGQMVLRFVYESLGELSAEETYYNDYRQSAWLANDRDMVRTLRQWLNETGL
jgi:Domain of unknown function (DUF1857)